jgi:hypothetical protein
MKKFGPLARALSVLGLVASTGFAQPVLAAQADVDLIKSYIGEYQGRGTFQAEERETLVCRLTLSAGNQDKVNFRGRCAVAGTTLSINGTIAYINNRYEAAMTSNASFSGTAIGQRSGQSIVFNFQDSSQDENGQAMSLTANITLQSGTVSVDFNVTTADGTYQATVPLNAT